MNRLLDRFCLSTLAAILLTLVVVNQSRANPDPDCANTCQMVLYGVKCFAGAPAGNAIEFPDPTCVVCDPTDPDNCRISEPSGQSCLFLHSTRPVRFATVFDNCPCNAGGTNYKNAEAWNLDMFNTDTANWPIKWCIGIE
jgi:hypothetical protein